MTVGAIRDEVGRPGKPNRRVTSSCSWSQIADRHGS